MASAKKIGLIACTGVVAGNMMGSGIALLPANLASLGSIAIIGWIVALIGAISLAYVYARLATKTLRKVVLSPTRVKSVRPSVFKPGYSITMQTGLVTLR